MGRPRYSSPIKRDYREAPAPTPEPISPGNWAIADLPGLDRTASALLQERGLDSTQALLEYCRDRDAISELARDLRLHDRHVQKWVSLATLARIPGVGLAHAGTFLHAGIATPQQLAAIPIHRLYPRLLRLFVATTQRRDLCPDRATVIAWISAARAQLVSSPRA